MIEFLTAWPDHWGWAWMLVGLTGNIVVIIAMEAKQ